MVLGPHFQEGTSGPMKRMPSTPASGNLRTISERICERISWSCFAHAVESAWTVSVPSVNATGWVCRAVSSPATSAHVADDVLARELRVPAGVAGEVGEHVGDAPRVASGGERRVLVVLAASPALAVRRAPTARARAAAGRSRSSRDDLGVRSGARRIAGLGRPRSDRAQASAASRMRAGLDAHDARAQRRSAHPPRPRP